MGIASCVVLGTWLGLTVGLPRMATAIALLLFVIALASHVGRWGTVSLLSLLAGILFLVWGGAAQVGTCSLSALVDAHSHLAETRVEIVGKIQSDMVEMPGSRGGRKLRFSFRTESVNLNGKSYPVVDKLRVTLYGVPRYSPVYGEQWRLKGALYPLKSYRASQRTRYGFRVGLSGADRIKETQSRYMAWSYDARRRASELLSAGMQEYPDVAGVVNALVLGYRANLPDDIRLCFMHTGIMHVFAISGIHVGILCAVLVFMIGVFRVPRPLWVVALAPMVITYACVTGARASAIRASVMIVAYLLAPLVRRRADSVSALAFAAVVILIWQPEQLMDMGFLYSFVVVAGIMAIVPLFDRYVEAWFMRDAFRLPDAPDPWWRGCLEFVVRMFSVSLAAWLTSAPLSLYFFGRFSPVALIGNVLAVPFTFLILVTGCLSIGIGSVAGWAGEIFNYANWCFVRILVSGMQAIERIPGGWAEWNPISIWIVVLWYFALISAVVILRRRNV